MTAGVLHVESRRDGVIHEDRLEADADACAWFGPGAGWRVTRIDATTRFELEVHGKAAAATACMPPGRARLLDDARQFHCPTAGDLETRLPEMAAGPGCLVHGDFDLRRARTVLGALRGVTLSWHPLEASGAKFVAFVQCLDRPLALDDYLRRDHAVIESALAGFLRGRDDRYPWLVSLLERHIRIEEALVFPPYLEAGGRGAWVRSLEMEHRQLRGLMCDATPDTIRGRLPRMLDSHDEKEERIVYPDVIGILGAFGAELAARAVLFGPG